MARCSRCAIDVDDDLERCPKCLRTTTLVKSVKGAKSVKGGAAAVETWGALPREADVALGRAPTIMAIGFLVIVLGAFLTTRVDANASDRDFARWTVLGVLPIAYGFQREIRAIGVVRTLVVFVTVCLAGATLGGGVVAIVVWLEPSTNATIALALAAALLFVGATWAVSRALDRAGAAP